MADRILLESGAPDGYQLEDGSGVLLKETNAVLTTASDSLAGSGGAFLLLLSGGVGVSESVSAVGTHPRTAADSIGSITETAARAPIAFARSASDSIASISESASRTFSPSRTAGDSLSAITEAVVGIKSSGANNYTASAADSLAGGGGGFLLLLSGGDIFAESVTAVVTPYTPQNLSRTAAESVDFITEAITYPPAFSSTTRGPNRLQFEPSLHYALSAGDTVEFIYEDATAVLTESDEWVVLDMPELVL